MVCLLQGRRDARRKSREPQPRNFCHAYACRNGFPLKLRSAPPWVQGGVLCCGAACSDRGRPGTVWSAKNKASFLWKLWVCLLRWNAIYSIINGQAAALGRGRTLTAACQKSAGKKFDFFQKRACKNGADMIKYLTAAKGLCDTSRAGHDMR